MQVIFLYLHWKFKGKPPKASLSPLNQASFADYEGIMMVNNLLIRPQDSHDIVVCNLSPRSMNHFAVDHAQSYYALCLYSVSLSFFSLGVLLFDVVCG